MLRRIMTSAGKTLFQARNVRFAGQPEKPISGWNSSHNTKDMGQKNVGKDQKNVDESSKNKGHSFTKDPKGKSEFDNKKGNAGGKSAELGADPEYKNYKSFDQIQSGKQNESKPWNADHLSANDEINHRGIDQRAKEWDIPAEKLEKLKPWEHLPSQSKVNEYKKTIYKGKEDTMYKSPSQRLSEHEGAQSKQSGKDFNEAASGTHQWDGKANADRKYTDKVSFDADRGQAGQTDRLTGKLTSHSGAQTRHINPTQDADKLKADKPCTENKPMKNDLNPSEQLDQGMMDKAMDWVKDKFGGANSSNRQDGPLGDHNAWKQGKDNHKDAVHKATFTEYKDVKEPFTSSTEPDKKSKRPEVKDYLKH